MHAPYQLFDGITLGMSDFKDMAQEGLKATTARIKPGVYRHYKGGEYIVFATSLKEDTLEGLVHYYSIEKKTRWTRTVADFSEASIPDSPYPRFVFVRDVGYLDLLDALGRTRDVTQARREDPLAVLSQRLADWLVGCGWMRVGDFLSSPYEKALYTVERAIVIELGRLVSEKIPK